MRLTCLGCAVDGLGREGETWAGLVPRSADQQLSNFGCEAAFGIQPLLRISNAPFTVRRIVPRPRH